MSFESECDGKVRFVSRKAARLARKRMPGNGHLNAYRCTFCSFWHLGHWNEHVREHARARRTSTT